MNKRIRIGIGAALLAPLLALAGAEVAYRVTNPQDAKERRELANFRGLLGGEDAVYRARPHTVYGLKPGPKVNSAGFRGPDWRPGRRPGVPRILCLGASTTEGGNAGGYEGSYPHLLEAGLEKELGIEVEVLNAGVSGWTTAETLVAYFLQLQDYEPDVVVIHHAVNDVMPRNRTDFQADYSHWRMPWRLPQYGFLERLLVRTSDFYARRCMDRGDGSLAALTTYPHVGAYPFTENGGSFPEETASPYRRNVLSIGRNARLRGAAVCLMTMPVQPPDGPDQFLSFRVGIADHNEILRQLAGEQGWLLADAERDFPTHPGLDRAAAFRDLVHLTPDGNRAKAELVQAALLAGWWPGWRDGR